MPLTEEDEQSVDHAMQTWRQGDVCLDDGLEFLHLADLSRPHSAASVQVTEMLARNDEGFERVSQFFRRGRHGLVLPIGFSAVSFEGFYAE